MKGTGILLNDDFDLQIKPLRNADNRIVKGLLVGQTLYQNQAIILITQPGEIKQMPVLGVALNEVLLDNDFTAFKKRVRQHMELDGQIVNSVSFSINNNLVIDAKYSDSI